MHEVSKTRLIHIIMFITVLSSISQADVNLNKILLPKEISIELHQNWDLFTNGERLFLDSLAKLTIDLMDIGQIESELPFAANYYDDNNNTIGIINLRYYPEFIFYQSDAISLTEQDIEDWNFYFEEAVITASQISNTPVSIWKGTKKITINSIVVLLTEYQRKSRYLSGDFIVRLFRVFNGDKSFTLTISYHESAIDKLKPQTDMIIQSLNVESIEYFNPSFFNSFIFWFIFLISIFILFILYLYLKSR